MIHKTNFHETYQILLKINITCLMLTISANILLFAEEHWTGFAKQNEENARGKLKWRVLLSQFRSVLATVGSGTTNALILRRWIERLASFGLHRSEIVFAKDAAIRYSKL